MEGGRESVCERGRVRERKYRQTKQTGRQTDREGGGGKERVCERGRESERQTDRQTDRQRGRWRECVCDECVCVCV